MASIASIGSSELLHARQMAQALIIAPDEVLSSQVDALKAALFSCMQRMLGSPAASSEGTLRTYLPSAQMGNHREITKILEFAKKHLIERKAVSSLPALESLEKPLAGLKRTCRIQIQDGFIDDVPFSKGSLIDSLYEDLDEGGLPFLGDRFSASLLESILACYRNHALKLDQTIPGDSSLSAVLSSHLTLRDLVKEQILLAQRSGKEAAEGKKAAFATFLETISQIDYLCDDEIAKVPCIHKFLYDYSTLSDEDLIDLHRELKDFPSGLLHEINVCVHIEVLRRKKSDAAFDTKLQTIDGALPADQKFYEKNFAPLTAGQEPSAERYAAELFMAPEADLGKLLKSKLVLRLPTVVLEALFTRCIRSRTFQMSDFNYKISKRIKESVYFRILRSNPAPYAVARLLMQAGVHGKAAVVQKILSENTSIPVTFLRTAFNNACILGDLSILELFRPRLASFLQGAEGIGLALNSAVYNGQRAVVDFLLQTDVFSTCPASGDNSFAKAAYIAARIGEDLIFEKLMEAPQFKLIPMEGEEHMVAILSCLAEGLQLSLVQRIMAMDQFKTALPEHLSQLMGPFCGTTQGVLLFGSRQGWEPLVQQIISSKEFEGMPASGISGIGQALEQASLYGNSSIVRSIVASSKFAEIPAVGDYSIAKAFYSAASFGYLASVAALLDSSRSNEIPLEGLDSFSAAFIESMERGHLSIFLKFVSHSKYRATLTGEQKAFIDQEHGLIQFALLMAITYTSLPLVKAIINSEQFSDIPLTGPISLTAAVESTISARDFSIANAILASRRAAEIPAEQIVAIWNQALVSEDYHSLALGILQGSGSIHIPMEGDRGLHAIFKRAEEEGDLSLFLAIQSLPRVQSSMTTADQALLREENGGVRRALATAARSGHLSLTRAIFNNRELFDSIPASGNHSLASAFELALGNGHMSSLQAFLDCRRSAEIPLSRREYALALLAYEASIPTNRAARFFWSLVNHRPEDPIVVEARRQAAARDWDPHGVTMDSWTD